MMIVKLKEHVKVAVGFVVFLLKDVLRIHS